MADETTSAKRDFRQAVTDSIIEMLEKGTAPWQKPWDPQHAFDLPLNPTSERAYRGGNAVHLMAVAIQRGYQDPRWLTYRQAQENGWQVRQGEKGTHIEFWQLSDTGRQRSDAGEPNSATQSADKESRGPLRRVYTVFNAQQIDGIPAYERKQRPEWEAVQTGERILEKSGAQISHDQRDRAFYNRASDSIHLPPKEAFRSPADYYGTALHELAHWSGHPARLDRQTLTESYQFGDTNYAKEELRAELASLFLAAERGIPHNPEQHAAYVASWVSALRNDKNEIFRAARDAHRAADFVLALEREKSVERGAESQLRRETSEHVAAYEPGSGTVDTVEKESATEHRTPTVTGHAKTSERLASAGLETEKILDGEVNGRRPTQEPSVQRSFEEAGTLTQRVLGDHARVYAAHTDSGHYSGEILGTTAHHVVQKLSTQSTVAHRKDVLPWEPEAGKNLTISYSNDQAIVKAFEPRGKAKELAR